MTDTGAGPVFCDDSELGYRRSRTDFAEGLCLRLDESYRLAHLPLVAPAHPAVITRREGRDYEMGRHTRIFSLVLPVDDAALRCSVPFLALEAELRASRFAKKIAWDLLPRRSDRLHATLCGSLGTGEPPLIERERVQALGQLGPIAVDLRGPFSGTVNLGRLYLRAYPEKRAGINLFHAIQDAMGRPRGYLYLVGLYNLIDDLDAEETAQLSELITRWWDVSFLRFDAQALWLLGACDDLVLDAAVAQALPLSSAPA